MLAGRYAPSPTGALHLGNLRTALAAYCFTRSRGGRFLLRIEDIDRPRVKEGAEEQQLRDLRLAGLNWDEEPIRQSDRTAVYEEQFFKLVERGFVYPCFCSRKDIQLALSAPHRDDGIQGYPGTCRELTPEKARARIDAGDQHSWRLRVSNGKRCLTDGIHGQVEFDLAKESGDFVVKRADGLYAYQFVCAVDDALSGVTEVLRGDDLLDSAARQQCVLEAVKLPVPTYYHIPLMTSENGERLSKRTGSEDMTGFVNRGYDPDAIRSYLYFTLGQCELGERLSMEQMAERFDLQKISHETAVFSEDQLTRFK